MLHNLREIAPTFYLAAPRSWDNHADARSRCGMEDSTPLKKLLYDFFMPLGRRAERRKLGGPAAGTGSACCARSASGWSMAPLKDQLGLLDAQALSPAARHRRGHVRVLPRARRAPAQLYGQTESSAFNAMQDDDEVRLHTVGRPLPGVELASATTARS